MQTIGLNPERFLADYWQQKPCVIRQGIENFKDFLSADELAGLAMEETVESRLISQQDGKWHAEFGPFESYDHLGERDWSLVVQATNHWTPSLEALIQRFDFLPRWRFDDVMVSFATPGGGVGPHIDLYDTFICQGSGRRHWRVGDKGAHKQFAAHEALRHTEAFAAIIDVELEPGDILYIPPEFPHEGVALENSMSFSVGYRSAPAREMLSHLADYVGDQELAGQQIVDPKRRECQQSGQIDEADFQRLKQQLMSSLNDPLLTDFFGSSLSQSKCELDLPEQSLDYEIEDLRELLAETELIRLGGLRCLYLSENVAQGVFYINGERTALVSDEDRNIAAFMVLLCDQQTLTEQDLLPWLDDDVVMSQLTHWLNQGYWYFPED